MSKVAIVGPVYPYRAGIAYCTTRLAEELEKSHDVSIVSFSRQYPKRFYPGGDDVDETLRDRTPTNAQFALDVVNPWTWLRAAMRLRRERPDAVVFVWWIWVWALPYLTLIALLPRKTHVILQCHNVGEKEPSWWKIWLSKRVLRRGDVLVVHAYSELDEALRRAPGYFVISTHLPVHELGGEKPPREKARSRLGITARNVALFFGHIRPFKGLDIALRAWPKLQTNVTLLVAGEAWWDSAEEYRKLASENVRFDFRYIPDSEIATYFAAADVVLAPYRSEAQSGVVLTAFHFERPVIGTTVGGIPEIVQDDKNGYLVPPEDPDALARAVDRFYTLADRGALERGAAASAALFSWEDYGRLFSSLVSGQWTSTRAASKSASS